jgi:hypothetical protein
MVWIGLIWLRIWTSGGLLWTQQWTFGFHKMLGNSWAASEFAASQEGLSSTSEFCINKLCVLRHRYMLRVDLRTVPGLRTSPWTTLAVLFLYWKFSTRFQVLTTLIIKIPAFRDPAIRILEDSCHLLIFRALHFEEDISSALRRQEDRLCRLVVRVPDYRSRDPGFDSGATRFSEK